MLKLTVAVFAGEYTAREYYRQLDGLGYEEIVELTDPGRERFLSVPGTPAFDGPWLECRRRLQSGRATGQLSSAGGLG
jgi:hypothetical protein